MYGESVFTTMRLVDGVIQDWELHYERLKKGVAFVYGPFTDGGDWHGILRNELEGRLVGLAGDKVVRLAVYREQPGRGPLRGSLVSVTDLRTHVAVSPLDRWPADARVALRTCPAPGRPRWWPPYLKVGNYLETILAQKLYLREGDDDLLFLADDGTVLETSIANVFVVRPGRLVTPPAGPDVLEGVMRRKVLAAAGAVFGAVVEGPTTLAEIRRADAVFGANSVRGLFLVDRIDDNEITYTQDVLERFARLRERVDT